MSAILDRYHPISIPIFKQPMYRFRYRHRSMQIQNIGSRRMPATPSRRLDTTRWIQSHGRTAADVTETPHGKQEKSHLSFYTCTMPKLFSSCGRLHTYPKMMNGAPKRSNFDSRPVRHLHAKCRQASSTKMRVFCKQDAHFCSQCLSMFRLLMQPVCKQFGTQIFRICNTMHQNLYIQRHCTLVQQWASQYYCAGQLNARSTTSGLDKVALNELAWHLPCDNALHKTVHERGCLGFRSYISVYSWCCREVYGTTCELWRERCTCYHQ
jgi:hypothetical protein